MRNLNLNDYRSLWEKPEKWLLGPIPEWVKSQDIFGSKRYLPYMKMPLGVAEVSIPAEIAETIINKMIDAGVEIVKEISYETHYEMCQHMWTDQKDEFVLCESGIPRAYLIYHKPSKSIIPIEGQLYNISIENMLKVGVEILNNIPTQPN